MIGASETSRSAIVMGRGSLAIHISRYFAEAPDWNLVAVVPSLPEPSAMASIVNEANRKGWPLVPSGDVDEALAVVGIERVSLGFSCYYNRILRPHQIAKFSRCLNLHSSALPAYRGVAPVNWALENGETSHGVTIHEVDAGIDTGRILGQVRFGIDPERDEVIDVYRRCLRFGRYLFDALAPELLTGTSFVQPTAGSSYYTQRDRNRLLTRTDFTRQSGNQDIRDL